MGEDIQAFDNESKITYFMPRMSSELTPLPSEKTIRFTYLGLTAAALAAGFLHATSLRFLNDDAFISFRYARNFAGGLGLVYNAGEKVEGYTNFLWTLILSGGMKLGLSPESLSTWLGIFFFLLTLALFSILTWKMGGDAPRTTFVVPLTTLALCLHRDFNAYATSGMETSMLTFLISAASALLLLGSSRLALAGAGAIAALAMMTRPDSVLFLGACVIYLFAVKPRPARSIVLFLLPSFVIFLPYWLWRWSYYGYFFPNAFYAKSIDLPYYRQGIEYAFFYFKTYYVFILILPLAAIVGWRWLRQSGASGILARLRSGALRPVLLAALAGGLYTIFIIRIGGDFMFARFFIPITPLLFLGLEMLIKSTASERWRLVVGIIVVAATFLRFDQFSQNVSSGYITDEARYYTSAHLEQSRTDGLLLRKYFAGLPVRVGFWAGQAKLIYYADPSYAIECSAGLTDPVIAHEIIHERGRPGHEKSAPIPYLMGRGVEFLFGPVDPLPQGRLVINAVVFDYILARMLVYNDSIMSRLAAFPDVHFIRFPEYLDSYLAQAQHYPPERIRQDFDYFKAFYFEHNNDSTRERKFVQLVSDAGRSLNGN